MSGVCSSAAARGGRRGRLGAAAAATRVLARAAGLALGVGAGLLLAAAVQDPGPAPARPARVAAAAPRPAARPRAPGPVARPPDLADPSRAPADRAPAPPAPLEAPRREPGAAGRAGPGADGASGAARDPARPARGAAAGGVRGRLRLAGAPPGARLAVVAVHRGPAGVQAWQAPVDADGRFELRGVPPGDVTLHAVRDGVALPGARRVELAPGALLSEVELGDAAAPVAARGRVLDPRGRPLAGVDVGPPGAPPVVTDAAGRFELVDLPLDPAGGLVALEARHPDHPPLRLEVALLPPPAPPPELTLRLAAGAATLVVRVVDGAGRPAAGVDVSLAGARAGAAPTGADGATVFTGLPPGEPHLAAVLDGPALEVVLGPGERREVTLRAP